MIVTLEPAACGELLYLTTFEPRRGRCSSFYINALTFGNWINHSVPGGPSFMDCDLNSFLRAYRDTEDLIHLEISFIRVNSNDDAVGFVQRFDLTLLFIKSVMITGETMKTLVPINRDPEKATITLTESAHCMVRRVAKDKLTRRALSKAMARSFFWKNSHVTLYADVNRSFFFREERICGGLILHSSTITGKDGKPHEKLEYSIHTGGAYNGIRIRPLFN